MAGFDLVVRGGTVYDGTGRDPREADVAIAGGRVVEIGRVTERGEEELSAKGCIVTPGFVDIHTHYDAHVTWESQISPSSSLGVTSVLMGNCGVGFAPCRAEDRDTLIRVMEGVEDIPGIVMRDGIPWSWESFPEYLDVLSERRFDIDIAAQVPHSPVRVFVMGERGVKGEPATAKDIAAMAAIVQQGIAAGALGFSTSRLRFHRLKDGSLAPTITAEEAELRGIAMALQQIDQGVLQMADSFLDPIPEFMMWWRIAADSGRSLSFNLTQNAAVPDKQWRDVLALVTGANQAGLNVRGQVINRPIGMIVGLETSLHPFVCCPTFRAIEKLPLAERVAQLRKPEVRARLLEESPHDPNENMVIWSRDLENIYPLSNPPNYCPDPQESLAAQARRRGVAPLEFAYDVLLEEEGRRMLFYPVVNFRDKNFDALEAMITHPYTMPGIADGGAHVGLICDASSPIHLITYWTRDHAGTRLSLSTAIESLTSRTAGFVGMNDRGVLAPGWRADVNVIDYDRLSMSAPRAVYDLPTGARRLVQDATGLNATIVNGQVTYRDGEFTGALPGRLVRGAQPRPT